MGNVWHFIRVEHEIGRTSHHDLGKKVSEREMLTFIIVQDSEI